SAYRFRSGDPYRDPSPPGRKHFTDECAQELGAFRGAARADHATCEDDRSRSGNDALSPGAFRQHPYALPFRSEKSDRLFQDIYPEGFQTNDLTGDRPWLSAAAPFAWFRSGKSAASAPEVNAINQ